MNERLGAIFILSFHEIAMLMLYRRVTRHTCAAKRIRIRRISQSVTQWTKARARFTAGIPKNTDINIVGGYARGTKGHVVAAGRGTGIKMDGANRMLIERSFIFFLYQFGEVTRGRSVARRSGQSSVYIELNIVRAYRRVFFCRRNERSVWTTKRNLGRENTCVPICALSDLNNC